MTTAFMGHQAKLATSSSGAVTEPFVFVSETIQKRGTIVEREGIRGTRSHTSADTRQGPYRVAGRLVLEPTPEDLAVWLPRILGAAASGTTYALAEALPDFNLAVDRGVKVFTYAGCKVDKATFSGSEGGLLRLSLDVVGKTEAVGNADTFPALTLTNTQPYIFSDLVLTLQAATREVKSFELTIDNRLVTDRFMNSTTVTDIPSADRAITLRTTHAWATDNAALYEQALAGAAGSMVFTNGGYSTTFGFATLQCPAESPTVADRQEVPLVLSMVARKTAGASELEVTHDSTA